MTKTEDDSTPWSKSFRVILDGVVFVEREEGEMETIVSESTQVTRRNGGSPSTTLLSVDSGSDRGSFVTLHCHTQGGVFGRLGSGHRCVFTGLAYLSTCLRVYPETHARSRRSVNLFELDQKE